MRFYFIFFLSGIENKTSKVLKISGKGKHSQEKKGIYLLHLSSLSEQDFLTSSAAYRKYSNGSLTVVSATELWRKQTRYQFIAAKTAPKVYKVLKVVIGMWDQMFHLHLECKKLALLDLQVLQTAIVDDRVIIFNFSVNGTCDISACIFPRQQFFSYHSHWT